MNNKPQFSSPGSPVTDADVSLFERILGIQLPLDYRAFLLQTNGGHPDPDAFPVQNLPDDTHALISCFFSLNDDSATENLMNNARDYRGRVPAELLPIANDPGGSLICIAVTGENRGAIYYWDHNDETPYGRIADYHNVYFVAHSFDELLNSLSELPDDE